MREFYIYIHCKPVTGEIFYIGKGKKQRAYSKNRSKWWKRTVEKYGLDVFILEDNLTEEESFKLEIEYIKRIGRKDLGEGTLVNMTDGGEGKSNSITSEETKKKMSIAHTGFEHTEESKNKMSVNHAKHWKGKVMNKSHIEKMSNAKIGKKICGVKVKNIITGEVYNSISEAAISNGINIYTLAGKLNDKQPNYKNNTNLIKL